MASTAGERESRARLAGRIAVTAAVYFAGARLALLLPVPGAENVGIFWPPAGISLALLWLWGLRTWPGLLLGAFLQAILPLVPRHSPASALAIALGETAADVIPAVLAVAWLRRALGDAAPLERVGDAARVVFWGGVVAQGLSAAMGVGTLWLAGFVGTPVLVSVGMHWWFSNVVSVAVLTPFCLAWRPPWRLTRPARHALVYALTAAAGLLVFAELPRDLHVHFRYVTILLVIGAAFALGMRGATAATAILCGLAIGSVASGHELVGGLGVDRQLLLLNAYLLTLGVAGVVVAAVLHERARTAAAFAEREAMLRAILDASPIPTAWSDRDGGRIEFWNRRAEELFGWTLEDVPTVGVWFERAYPEPHYRARLFEEWSARAAEARRTGGDIAFSDLEVTCKDGTVRPVDLRARFAGERVLVLFTDLADRRRADAQREELREQLARAQRMESVGRLAGGIAHDLNNMLAPVLGLADVLLEDATPGTEGAEDLAEIKRAAGRARDLTRELLAFGGRQVLETRLVDLRTALAGVEKLLRRAIREDVRIEVHSPPQLGLVRADVGRIEQVLMNLAVNAQLAMAEGGRLTIELADVRVEPGGRETHGVPPGEWVRLSVSDTGCGMEPAVLDRVFDPFFTTRMPGEGTGLGLAIVHGIVTQHGGQVRAESATGHGSTFHVYLPRAGPEEPALTPSEPAAREARARPAGSGTVLVVEDEDAVRHVTVRILQRLGYRVIATGSAAECLRVAADPSTPVDLLLTDVVMPDLNGRQLYERLAASRPGLRVLFMSGYPGDVVTQRGVPLEGLELLQKPFTSEGLAEAVERVLAGASVARA